MSELQTRQRAYPEADRDTPEALTVSDSGDAWSTLPEGERQREIAQAERELQAAIDVAWPVADDLPESGW